MSFDLIVRAFQTATTSLRYSPKPVVAAPFQLALGGGCEVAMHADRVRAAAETYIGLVEVGVVDRPTSPTPRRASALGTGEIQRDGFGSGTGGASGVSRSQTLLNLGL